MKNRYKFQFVSLVCLIAATLIFCLNPSLNPPLDPDPMLKKCTTIIVGKNASQDGSVLLGHNEDLGDHAAQHYITVPRAEYEAGATIATYFGAQISQVEETLSYSATTVFDESYIPGAITSGINEYQVAVANNLAYQREATYPEPSRGRLMWSEFMQFALERAQSARQAVQIIGDLVNTYGNYGPGSIMGITDANEGWWLEFTQEGQWVAQRVQDDEVSMRANTYAIGVVDFDDTENFMYSDDLVSYAVSRGWYSQGEGDFDFTEIYADSQSNSDSDNTHRQIWVNSLLNSFTPNLTPADIMSILRNHYEGSDYEDTDDGSDRSPHHTSEYTVCNLDTEISLVCQSRDWLPARLGGLCWRAMSTPCSSVFTPWYMGMTEIPAVYQNGTQRPTSDSAYWAFRNFIESVDENYIEEIEAVQSAWLAVENLAFENQADFEQTALDLLEEDETSGLNFITSYANSIATNTYLTAQGLPMESDETAPTVTATIPAANQSNVSLSTPIIVTFSEPIDSNTLNTDTIKVSDGTKEISGSMTGNWVTSTFTPDADLSLNQTYTVTVTNDIMDLAGNPLEKNIVFTFQTGSSSQSSDSNTSSGSGGGGSSGGCFLTATFRKTK